jgi:DNA-binding HxlR family transcriptional regulator
MPGHRTYDQDCPIANALDVLGERWTLLILRELVGGPRRYSDLRAQLPGIATNLLAQRLHELLEAGLAEREQLPPPIARTLYALTDDGWHLVLPILSAVARFGLHTMKQRTEGSRSPLNGFLVGVLLGFDPVRAAGIEATCRVQVDDRSFDFTITEGRLARSRGTPDVTVTASASDLVDARLGSTATQRRAALRRLRFHGKKDGVDAMRTALRLTGAGVASAAMQLSAAYGRRSQEGFRGTSGASNVSGHVGSAQLESVRGGRGSLGLSGSGSPNHRDGARSPYSSCHSHHSYGAVCG